MTYLSCDAYFNLLCYVNMNLLGRNIIDDFKKRHSSSRKPFDRWIKLIESADFKNPQEVKQFFGVNVDFVGQQAVFDVGGRNSFMSIAKKLMKTLKEEVKSTSIQMDKSYHKLVALFPLQPIVTKDQHTIALKVIERVISFVDSETEDEGIKVYLKTLVKLVGEYERENYKSQSVTGREMLAYLMDLQGLTQKDLAKEVGGQPIVSKILKGERDLNIRQVKALAKRFKVSPEVFI